MRLEAYLLTEGRSKSITLDKAWDIIEKKCMQSAKAYYKGDAKIYRGIMNRNDALFVDPESGKPRRSANTTNHYTLLVDNLPSWKNFPKRSKSLICSTDRTRAFDHGSAYAVFPYNGSKIGLLPEDDMWFSFKKIRNLRTFNDRLDELLQHVIDMKPSTKDIDIDKDWKTLKKVMKLFDMVVKDRENILKAIVALRRNPYDYPWLENYTNSMIKTLDKVFDPISNGIELTTTGKNLPSKEQELWTNGKSVLISIMKTEQEDLLMDKLKEITI